MARLANTIEAILYLKAQPLTISEIAEYAQCDRETAEDGLIELMSDYAHRDGALEIVETPNGYSLQLRESFHHLVHTLVPTDLGVGALRTLAAIALKGPLPQTLLVEIRGSNAYHHVHELVEQGFVQKRRQSDGRSYWLQVTDKFHQYFQLNQLPQGLDPYLKPKQARSEGNLAQPASIPKTPDPPETTETSPTDAIAPLAPTDRADLPSATPTSPTEVRHSPPLGTGST